MIVEYLEETDLSIDTEMYRRNISSGEGDAKETAYLRKEQFIGDLELAQSYGQIDNVNSIEDKEEKILQIVNEWYESCVDSANYGFFKRIMTSYLEEIRRESKTREKDLVEQLDVNGEGLLIAIRQPLAGDIDWNEIISLGFTHHMEILSKMKDISERLFYIHECAVRAWDTGLWSAGCYI